MSFVMPIVAVVPMRKEPSHRSEMVSQLLFGELAMVKETSTDFVLVQTLYDDYEGWCQQSQLIFLEHAPDTQSDQLSTGWASALQYHDTTIMIGAGTPLHLFKNGELVLPEHRFIYSSKTWKTGMAEFNESSITSIAMQYLNSPYLWGGRTVFGIDCSGFAQQVYRHFGKHLPRDAYQQAEKGETVGFLQEAICGDLAFFDNPEGKITHVGIMLGPDTIIHASGQVRTDRIDNMGIVHSGNGKRTHQLRIIKRYV